MNPMKKERVKKFGEVFTPQWVVDQMCDALEGENPECYRPETTFLEPTCGDGVFVLEIFRRKFANCKTRTDYTTAIESVWAMEIQADNVQKTIDRVSNLCRQYFMPTKAEMQTINDHVIQCDSLKVMKLLNWWERKGGDDDNADAKTAGGFGVKERKKQQKEVVLRKRRYRTQGRICQYSASCFTCPLPDCILSDYRCTSTNILQEENGGGEKDRAKKQEKRKEERSDVGRRKRGQENRARRGG